MSKRQFYWFINRFTFCEVVRFMYRFRMQPDSDPEPEPPYIVVANHGNFFDPWMLGQDFKKALHIMTNEDGFRAGGLGSRYLSAIGSYAKKKGSVDITAMKKTISFLRAKEPVLIFPEGQTTWDGETQPIYGGVERIVKRTKSALVIIKLRGTFLSRPWWATGKRKGKIRITRTVIPKEKIAEMSLPEILEAIKQGIYTNDVLDPENKNFKFKGKRLAEGLERLLWICPKCKASDTLLTEEHTITCSKCNASWAIDPYCEIKPQQENCPSPDNLHAWVADHKASVKAMIADVEQDAMLAHNTGITLQLANSTGTFEPDSDGTLSINHQELTYGPNSKDGTSLTFPVNNLDNFVIQQKDIFEITHDGTDYRFHMNGQSPMKWLMFTRYLNGFEEVEKTGVL